MKENVELSGKQIASFIVLSLAMATPVVIAQENTSNGDMLADATAIMPSPSVVEPNICRYAGPEYFGFYTNVDSVKVAEPPQITDTAQYMQVQTNILNDTNVNANINTGAQSVNIKNVQPNNNFINTEYGSVKVIEPSGHYIFK